MVRDIFSGITVVGTMLYQEILLSWILWLSIKKGTWGFAWCTLINTLEDVIISEIYRSIQAHSFLKWLTWSYGYLAVVVLQLMW